MSWLQKLKTKTKSKDNLGSGDGAAGSIPTSPVNKVAPDATGDGSGKAAASRTASENALNINTSAVSAPPAAGGAPATVAAIEAGVANIKLKAVHPTQGTNAQVAQALSAKAVSGLLQIRVLEGRDVVVPSRVLEELRGGGSASSNAQSGTPAHLPFIVLSYDKNEVVVNASAGSLVAPVWRSRATFDLTHETELGVHVFIRMAPSSSSPTGAHPHGGDGDQQRVGLDAPHPHSGTSGQMSPGCMPSDVHLGSTVVEYSTIPTKPGEARDLWLPVYLPTSTHPTAHVHLQLTHRALVGSGATISIDDFELLKVIGKGSFGKVMQVRKKDTGRIYALKILKKSHIVSREEVTHTLSERNVLMKLRHPFIVNLKFSFQSSAKLYLVLPFINGGELFKHLSQEGRFEEERARFYAAELTTALECLHSYDIIYRDLKPENILLDYSGHIALCDFGLCKLNMGDGTRTNTFCGTPEYLACEVLLSNGYTKSVDWWTLGVLLFEMLTGLPPFYDENLNEMYRKILYAPLSFPSFLSPTAQSLLSGLLDRDPERRLGSANRGGAAEIKAHPFFATVDWRALLEKKITPPFKPAVENAFDTSNFDEEFTSEVPCDSVVNDSVLSQTVQGQFAGFTYIPGNDLTGAAGGTYQAPSSVIGAGGSLLSP
ncbi:Serine/threonine-protein kinase [Blastocladiella emersonii ATCC 22665]|nr:Serine/threonine-protein kinase [Blastocladiella emersonii ATCC 22665]